MWLAGLHAVGYDWNRGAQQAWAHGKPTVAYPTATGQAWE